VDLEKGDGIDRLLRRWRRAATVVAPLFLGGVLARHARHLQPGLGRDVTASIAPEPSTSTSRMLRLTWPRIWLSRSWN